MCSLCCAEFMGGPSMLHWSQRFLTRTWFWLKFPPSQRLTPVPSALQRAAAVLSKMRTLNHVWDMGCRIKATHRVTHPLKIISIWNFWMRDLIMKDEIIFASALDADSQIDTYSLTLQESCEEHYDIMNYEWVAFWPSGVKAIYWLWLKYVSLFHGYMTWSDW